MTRTAINCLHTKHTKFNQYIQKVILVVQGHTDKHMHICRLQTDRHCTVLTYNQVIVRTATRSILNMAANLTQILNFKANFHKQFELFSKKNFMLTMVDCQHNKKKLHLSK